MIGYRIMTGDKTACYGFHDDYEQAKDLLRISQSHDPAATLEKYEYESLYEKATRLEAAVAVYENAEKRGFLAWLPEPRLPLVWGDNEHNTVLCPRCSRDLMGGYEDENTDAEYPMYQCPHCGQPIDCTGR